MDATIAQLLCALNYETGVERHLISLVTNRALNPHSKLGPRCWVGRHMHIADLSGEIFTRLGIDPPKRIHATTT